jgi:hypothetical protein
MKNWSKNVQKMSQNTQKLRHKRVLFVTFYKITENNDLVPVY